MSEEAKMTVTVIPAKPKEELESVRARASRKTRVAAYCRVSTDEEEQLNSFEVQCQYYTKLIESKEEWQLVKIFADEGKTGTQMKQRADFLKMMRYARLGKIDLILAKSVSRFARNTVESLDAIRELKSLGVSVFFEKEGIDTLAEQDETMITIFSWMAQAESESISKNVTWGKRRAFEQGHVIMNYSAMIGYTRGEDNKPRIDPEGAETVKMIYNMFLKGMSLKQIAEKLTELKRPTSKEGGKWTQSTIQSILKNEKYTGGALLQKTYTVDCISHAKKKNNGELPMYYVSNHHEGIIDKGTFRKVQEEFARRTSKRRVAHKLTTTETGKYSAKYALTEKMFCAECGTPYRRVTWTAKGYKEIKWRCINRIENGKAFCHNSPTMAEDKLHDAIVAALNTFCDEHVAISKVLNQSISEVLAEKSNIIPRLEMAKAEKSNEIARLLAISTAGEDVTAFDERFRQLSDEIMAINEQIETERSKAIPDLSGTNELQTILDNIASANHTVSEYEDQLTRLMIEKILIIDKATIEIEFKGGFKVKQQVA